MSSDTLKAWRSRTKKSPLRDPLERSSVIDWSTVMYLKLHYNCQLSPLYSFLERRLRILRDRSCSWHINSIMISFSVFVQIKLYFISNTIYRYPHVNVLTHFLPVSIFYIQLNYYGTLSVTILHWINLLELPIYLESIGTVNINDPINVHKNPFRKMIDIEINPFRILDNIPLLICIKSC